MSQENERNLAERWFVDTRLVRISYGPMRRILANLLDEFGVDPFDATPSPQPGTVQTSLIPDTPFQLTDEFSRRLTHNLARFMNVDSDLVAADVRIAGATVVASATLKTKGTA